MTGRLTMGERELCGNKILEMVKQEKMTLKEASAAMGVSYRQGKRLYAAYRTEGDTGLIHGNCGKRSNNRTPEEKREAIILLYREKYPDFGPTVAAERLEEVDGIKVNAGTLRNQLRASGDWQCVRKRKEYRSRRERRAKFGEPAPFDGIRHNLKIAFPSAAL